jgi:8-oxo-dGTP pyrophosphatase MutT (NUDIX family)
MTFTKEGSVILFENADGQLAFQLRDDRPDVSCANHWGLFGGWQEIGESPEQTISREIKEELGLQLDPAKLRYLRRYYDGDSVTHVFHHPATDELRYAHLSEGQRLEFLRLSDLVNRDVVPRHRDILEWYERQRTLPSNSEVP